MARSTERYPDPIVRDLQAIRRLDWSQPDGFTALEKLLKHPLVVHRADDPKDDPQLVEALREVLEETIARTEVYEKEHPPPFGRSVAVAGTALLRLKPEFASMSLEDIRAYVVKRWGKKGGGTVSVDGFRQHIEISEVYVPLAGEFWRLADDFEREKLPGESPQPDNEEEPPTVPIADRLREMEKKTYEERLAYIDDGVLKVRNEDEMLKYLVMLTESARHDLRAVDLSPASEWHVSPQLNSYLRFQLKRVRASRKVTLERIRAVTDDEMKDEGRSREQLDHLIKLHDEAGAKLLLCRPQAVEDLELNFKPDVGLLVIDADAETTAITGKLGEGSIGRARVYLRETDEVSQFLDEYNLLRMTAVGHDRELREKLARTR